MPSIGGAGKETRLDFGKWRELQLHAEVFYKISRGLMPLLSSTQLRTEGLRLILEISRPDLLAMPHLYSAALGRLSSALALEPQIRSA